MYRLFREAYVKTPLLGPVRCQIGVIGAERNVSVPFPFVRLQLDEMAAEIKISDVFAGLVGLTLNCGSVLRLVLLRVIIPMSITLFDDPDFALSYWLTEKVVGIHSNMCLSIAGQIIRLIRFCSYGKVRQVIARNLEV